jgi:hypothetical protein
MMKEGKFREDSASVLSAQLHFLTVRRYLGQGNEPQRGPRPTRGRARRARREAKYYRRLGWLVRLFPLTVGIVCGLVLWDSQREADRFRVQQLATLPVTDLRPPVAVPLGKSEAASIAISEQDALSRGVVDVHPRAAVREPVISRPSQALLLSVGALHADAAADAAVPEMSATGMR